MSLRLVHQVSSNSLSICILQIYPWLFIISSSSHPLHVLVIPGLFSFNLPPLPYFFSSVATNYSPSLFWNLIFSDEGLWDTFVKHLPPGSFSYTISLDRLRSGVAYEFRVIAVNRFGYGDPSPPSTAMSGNLPHFITPLRYTEQMLQMTTHWTDCTSVPRPCFCLHRYGIYPNIHCILYWIVYQFIFSVESISMDISKPFQCEVSERSIILVRMFEL